MKKKISISIEDSTIALVERIVDGSKFRNKSHMIEHAVDLFLKEHLKGARSNIPPADNDEVNLDSFTDNIPRDNFLLKEKYHVLGFNKKWLK